MSEYRYYEFAKARHERETAIAREEHLVSLVGREQKLWAKADALSTTTQPTSCDLAVKILVDLRDLDARCNGDSFHSRMKRSDRLLLESRASSTGSERQGCDGRLHVRYSDNARPDSLQGRAAWPDSTIARMPQA